MLDHIERIGELGDLADVEPTSHVVAVENALRADEPRPSLPGRDRAAERARGRHGRLPRPQPGPGAGMSRGAVAHRGRGGRARPCGRARPGGAVARLPRARRRRRLQRLHLGRAGRRAARGRPRGAARRRAGRGQGPVLHRRRAEPGRLEDPRGLPPAVHRDERRPADRRRRAAARQDEPGRVRDGLVDRALRATGRRSTHGTAARVPGGSSGGVGRRRRGGQRAVGDRHRHRRLDPPAGRAVRHRRAQADVRRGQPLRDDRVRVVARPGRAVDARRDRRRAAVRRDGRPGPVRLDVASGCPSRSGCRSRTDLRGVRLGVPEELSGEGIEPGVLASFNETLDRARELGAERRAVPAAARAARAQPPTT